MKNNQLHWDQIRPNFEGSNSAMRNANDMQSKVGNAITESMKGLQGIGDILGKEKTNIEQNREQYFNEMGKKIAEQANLEGMEVVTFDDGTSGHRFNYEKAMLAKQRMMQEEFDNYANGTGEEMSEKDFARLWNAGNMDNYMKEGIKNSQDNATNKIERDKLKEDTTHHRNMEQIQRESAWLNAMKQSGKSEKDIANNIDTNKYSEEGIGYLISDDFDMKSYDDFINRVNQILPYMDTRPQDKQYLSFFTDKERVQNTIEYFNSKPNLSQKDKINYLAKQLGMNKKDIEESPIFNEIYKEIDRVDGIKDLKDKNNNGIIFNQIFDDIIDKRNVKTTSKMYDSDKRGLKKLSNLLVDFYIASNPKATKDEVISYVKNTINNKLDVDSKGNMYGNDEIVYARLFNGSGSDYVDKLISDILSGNYTELVNRLVGQLDEKQFRLLQSTASKKYKMKMNDYNEEIAELIQEDNEN